MEICRFGEKICEIYASPGDTLLQAISDAGVYLDAPCGGAGCCGKCLVRTELDGDEVLACRTFIDKDMRVFLPDESKMKIADSVGSLDRSSDFYCECENFGHMENSVLGVAVDVGTTTVAASLIDCGTGRIIATASGVNAQRVYGADVISRISYSAKNGHEKLTKLIRSQIEALIWQMLPKNTPANREQPRIERIVIAGNTIMQHLVAGYSPVSMGTVPFATISLFGMETPIWEGLPASPDGKVYYTPAIAAYIGGDVTAGLLAVEGGSNFWPSAPEVSGQANSNFWPSGSKVDGQANPNFRTTGPEVERTLLFLDIGTNGELVLKHKDKYYSCATAAGPAFEGAQIEMGMAATDGAISHAKWDEEENCLKLTVIGDTEPIGICGSGLLDILAYLVENGRLAEIHEADIALPLVDETGRLENCTSVSKGADRFYLTDSVYITSEDVRKLQLAKAAIAAGIQTLLESAGIGESQIDTLVLAGGFGNYLDKNSAAKIGLIPGNLLAVTQAAGNTALSGAVHTLCNANAEAELESIRERMEYIELSTSKVFNKQFVEQMMF